MNVLKLTIQLSSIFTYPNINSKYKISYGLIRVKFEEKFLLFYYDFEAKNVDIFYVISTT